MKIALDCNALIELSRPDDPVSQFRFLHLIKEQDAVLVVPTPVVAEFLVRAEAEGVEWLSTQRKRRNFILGAFDYRAAQECALLEQQAVAAGMKRPVKQDSRQKIKVDRQILAIARVAECELIMSADGGLRAMATWLELPCQRVDELPLPPEDAQLKLDIPPVDEVDGTVAHNAAAPHPPAAVARQSQPPA